MHRNASERAPLVVRSVGPWRTFAACSTSAADRPLIPLPSPGPASRYTPTSWTCPPSSPSPAVISRTPEWRTVSMSAVATCVPAPWAKPTTWCSSPPSATCSAPPKISTCCAAAAKRSRPAAALSVQDFILEADKTAPRFAALFALNMLVGTQAGASYSQPEYAAWAGEAGFRRHPPRPPAGSYRPHDRRAAMNVPFRRLSRDFRGIVGSPVAEAGEVGYECQKRLVSLKRILCLGLGKLAVSLIARTNSIINPCAVPLLEGALCANH